MKFAYIYIYIHIYIYIYQSKRMNPMVCKYKDIKKTRNSNVNVNM